MEEKKQTQETALTETEQRAIVLERRAAAEFALTPIGQQIKQFEINQRIGQMYNASTIVPKAYQGQQGLSNCIIAVDMAGRMGANPLMVMQNLAVVNGNPSFSAKFLIACVNASGRYTTLAYEWKGKEGTDEWGCRAYAYEKTDTAKANRLEGAWIDIAMAKKEGWSTKNGSKWQTMPQQMLIYRAAAFWQRAYCPEISMGLLTQEEAADIQDAEYEDVTERVRRSNTAERPAAPTFNPEPAEQPEPEPAEQPAQPEPENEPKRKAPNF